MTPDQIKRCTTTDLELEYFNLCEYLKLEYLRVFLPTILFVATIALHDRFLQLGNEDAENWISLPWSHLTTIAAFICAIGVMYFGGRAWHSTKIVIAIRSELLSRAGQSG